MLKSSNALSQIAATIDKPPTFEDAEIQNNQNLILQWQIRHKKRL